MIQFQGYRLVSNRTTEFEMIGEDGSGCTVRYCVEEPLNPHILTDSIDWFFTFPGNDPEPTFVKGLCSFILDGQTRATVAKIRVVDLFMADYSKSDYLLDSPDGEILIRSYSDSSYDFFRDNERVAGFAIRYDPKHRQRRFGIEFPAFYSAYCSEQLSEITRVLVLSIPFLRYIGIGTAGRVEAEALKHYGSNEKLQYLESFRSYPVSKCSVTFLLGRLTPLEREKFENHIGLSFPLQSYRWLSQDQLTVSEIDISNIEEMEKILLQLAAWYPHTEIKIDTRYGGFPENLNRGQDDFGGYLAVYCRDGEVQVEDVPII